MAVKVTILARLAVSVSLRVGTRIAAAMRSPITNAITANSVAIIPSSGVNKYKTPRNRRANGRSSTLEMLAAP